MKLILENWRQYLKEDEATYFPWLNELRATDDMEEQRDIVESDRFIRIGGGAFRTAYQPVDDPGYVIKLANGGEPGEKQMNKDDFNLAKRYPLISPKAYAHADDFSWVVMEKVFILAEVYGAGEADNGIQEMQRVLEKSFPTELEALSNIDGVQRNPFGEAWDLENPFDVLEMIMASFRADRRKAPSETDVGRRGDFAAQALQDVLSPVAGAAYQELSKAMYEFTIDRDDIADGNIGHDGNYNFKIIDSSVFEPYLV